MTFSIGFSFWDNSFNYFLIDFGFPKEKISIISSMYIVLGILSILIIPKIKNYEFFKVVKTCYIFKTIRVVLCFSILLY